MWRALATLVIGLVGVLVALGLTFFIGMRAKAPFVQDRVRRFNRTVTNRRVLRSAGSAGASASLIRHVGRTSGQAYSTPVEAMVVGDDFVIALPYGTRADWLKNVLVAGSATIVDGGVEHRVDRPVVVPTAEVLDQLPAHERRMLRAFKVGQSLRVRRVAEPAAEARTSAETYG